MCQTMRGKPIYFLSNGPPLRESDICLDKGSACGILGIPVPVVSYNCYTSMKERIYAPFKKGALHLIWGGSLLRRERNKFSRCALCWQAFLPVNEPSTFPGVWYGLRYVRVLMHPFLDVIQNLSFESMEFDPYVPFDVVLYIFAWQFS